MGIEARQVKVGKTSSGLFPNFNFQYIHKVTRFKMEWTIVRLKVLSVFNNIFSPEFFVRTSH